ncbi:HVO_0234 family beta-propeller protein [Halobacterium zhouii]|uniref:HVO_0234 family beta-propeller protein n=1 Tax=Halobacterium zhouii TaxID=2902624 RepID=UPI001E62D9BF|nr:hypothetical protein [Halobacterium zhouii]
MSSIDEKRVYADQTGTVTAYVAADLGVAAVSVSGDIVGEFTLVERCTARDVAATARGVAVAADDGVLLGDGEVFERVGDGSDAGFDAAVAVTGLDGDVVAADASGRVARYDGTWQTVGTCGEVRALDGDLVAAADGVHRIAGDSLAPAGLEDARDVANASVPRAATPEGLFRLGNGWIDELQGTFQVVDAATGDEENDILAHAATSGAFYELAGGDWRERDLPVEERVAGVAYGPAVVEREPPDDSRERRSRPVLAVTDAGTLLVDAGDGFRHRALGLPGASAIAAVSGD